jgi:DNA polymerase
VFGEGAEAADLVLVGEQPGDQEDLAGHPFVGPAGKSKVAADVLRSADA